MKITIVSFAMVAAFGLISCDNTKHNTLTEQEKAEGWELLFDGKPWMAGGIITEPP